MRNKLSKFFSLCATCFLLVSTIYGSTVTEVLAANTCMTILNENSSFSTPTQYGYGSLYCNVDIKDDLSNIDEFLEIDESCKDYVELYYKINESDIGSFFSVGLKKGAPLDTTIKLKLKNCVKKPDGTWGDVTITSDLINDWADVTKVPTTVYNVVEEVGKGRTALSRRVMEFGYNVADPDKGLVLWVDNVCCEADLKIYFPEEIPGVTCCVYDIDATNVNLVDPNGSITPYQEYAKIGNAKDDYYVIRSVDLTDTHTIEKTDGIESGWRCTTRPGDHNVFAYETGFIASKKIQGSTNYVQVNSGHGGNGGIAITFRNLSTWNDKERIKEFLGAEDYFVLEGYDGSIADGRYYPLKAGDSLDFTNTFFVPDLSLLNTTKAYYEGKKDSKNKDFDSKYLSLVTNANDDAGYVKYTIPIVDQTYWNLPVISLLDSDGNEIVLDKSFYTQKMQGTKIEFGLDLSAIPSIYRNTVITIKVTYSLKDSVDLGDVAYNKGLTLSTFPTPTNISKAYNSKIASSLFLNSSNSNSSLKPILAFEVSANYKTIPTNAPEPVLALYGSDVDYDIYLNQSNKQVNSVKINGTSYDYTSSNVKYTGDSQLTYTYQIEDIHSDTVIDVERTLDSISGVKVTTSYETEDGTTIANDLKIGYSSGSSYITKAYESDDYTLVKIPMDAFGTATKDTNLKYIYKAN